MTPEPGQPPPGANLPADAGASGRPPTLADRPALPARLNLLIIDDDEVDRMRLARLLGRITEWTSEIHTAMDRTSGLAALRAARFDCVLLDYRLPDGDAMDVLREARAAEAECPPFVIQTVLDHEETAVRTLGLGAQDYLVKGQFDAALLRRTIRYAIERDRLIKERSRLQRELQTASAHIRDLEGLLPICSNCKSIRDDQGVWHSIEDYIAERSPTTFSHGVCPVCLKKHYAWAGV
jgi:sigma-B regulation protein RsbU (phosphoserine phosphatase)